MTVDTLSTPGSGASLSVGERWNDTWLFTAHCQVSRCTLTADAELAAPGFAARPFTMTLRSSGGHYSGSAQAEISMCGSAKVTNTVTMSITPKGQSAFAAAAWSAWTGTMQISAPYTTVGNGYCSAGSWSFAVSGTDG